MKGSSFVLALAALPLVACMAVEPASDEDGQQTVSPDTGGKGTTTTAEKTEPLADAKPLVSLDVACEIGTKTALGCEVSYEINLAQASHALPKLCIGSHTIYNDCDGSPIELAWHDSGTKAPKAVRIDLGISLFCASSLVDAAFPQPHGVSVNDGSTFGGFEADPTACTCEAPTVKHSFDMTKDALEGYKPGGENKLKVNGTNRCIGMSPLAGTVVARVVATY